MKYGMPGTRLANRDARPRRCPSLEEARHALGDRQPEVLVCPLGQDPAARGALHQTLLEEVGLEDVLDRVGFLADRDGERGEANRSSRELRGHQLEELAIMAVESGPVHLEHLERIRGELRVDLAPVLDLRKVADTAQQPVGHPRGPPGATRDLLRAVRIDLDVEDSRRAQDDLAKIRGLVVLEPVGDAEAVAQRCRQQTGARGRADQGKRRKVEGDRAGPRPLTEDDRQTPVLHRRVERLLHCAPQSMDLVDEEDAARLERGQKGGDVGLALQGRAGRLNHRHAQLRGDDVREGGLAETGRTGEQHVVQGLPPAPCGLDEDPELLGHLDLVDEVLELRWTERSVEVVVGPDRPSIVDHHLDVIVVDARGADPLARLDAHAAFAPAALRSADCTISSGLSPSAAARSFSASGGVYPRLSRPSRARERASSSPGSSAAASASPSISPATFSRSSTMIRSAVRLPTPGTAWKRLESPAAIARSNSLTDPPESTAIATLGPTPP